MSFPQAHPTRRPLAEAPLRPASKGTARPVTHPHPTPDRRGAAGAHALPHPAAWRLPRLPSRPLDRPLLVGLAAWAVIAGVVVAVAAGSIDLAVYLRAAADLAAGRDPNATPAGALPWLYPPAAAALFVPLVALPQPVAAGLVALASLAALARLLHLVLARLVPGRGDLTVLAVALAVVSEPVTSTLGYGQLNLVVGWLVAEGFLGRRRWLVGVAAGLKLTPLVFMLPLIVRRDRRGLAETCAGFAGTVALGWLVAPTASLGYWTGLFLQAPARVGAAYASNQSLTAAAWRAFGPGGAAPLVLVGSALVVGVTALVLWRFPADDVLALGVTGLAGVLLSPLSWVHHWVWLLVLVPWLLAHGFRVLALAWAAATTLRPVWWYPSGAGLEFTHDPLGKLLQASWTVLALVTLGVLASTRGARDTAVAPSVPAAATGSPR